MPRRGVHLRHRSGLFLSDTDGGQARGRAVLLRGRYFPLNMRLGYGTGRGWGAGVVWLGPANMRRDEGGGGGSGTQKILYQKWPDQIFPFVNVVLPTTVTLVCSGGVQGGEGGAGSKLLRRLSAVLL